MSGKFKGSEPPDLKFFGRICIPVLPLQRHKVAAIKPNLNIAFNLWTRYQSLLIHLSLVLLIALLENTHSFSLSFCFCLRDLHSFCQSILSTIYSLAYVFREFDYCFFLIDFCSLVFMYMLCPEMYEAKYLEFRGLPLYPEENF